MAKCSIGTGVYLLERFTVCLLWIGIKFNPLIYLIDRPSKKLPMIAATISTFLIVEFVEYFSSDILACFNESFNSFNCC